MLNLTQIKRKINYHFLEEEKEVNLNKLPKKKNKKQKRLWF